MRFCNCLISHIDSFREAFLCMHGEKVQLHTGCNVAEANAKIDKLTFSYFTVIVCWDQ